MTSTNEAAKEGRTLVLCFDGTSNEYSADNTNVVKFFALLEKDNPKEQLCYYQAGVGTYYNPGVVSPFLTWGAKVLDVTIARYLDEHVTGGYEFLMQNYRPGDKICLFGFSRGAYTARALAGALYKVGLLPRDNEVQVPFAFKLYKREDKEGIELSAGFKRIYSQDVVIEFLGVWDTVASVGVITSRTLPFVNSNRAIKTFRHALSLDERRARFMPNTYHRPAPNKGAAKHDPEHASPVEGTNNVPGSPSNERKWSSLSPLGDYSGLGYASFSGEVPFQRKDTVGESKEKSSEGPPVDDVLEVWFAGCHQDIGGGGLPDSARNSLANISLRWMVQEVVKSRCGIRFNQGALEAAQIGLVELSSDKAMATAQSRFELDAVDALQPMHDGLKLNMFWWILEVIPMPFPWQDKEGVWHRRLSMHMGKGRTISEKNPIFHNSVKQRMESDLKYIPRAKWEKGRERYVS